MCASRDRPAGLHAASLVTWQGSYAGCCPGSLPRAVLLPAIPPAASRTLRLSGGANICVTALSSVVSVLTR